MRVLLAVAFAAMVAEGVAFGTMSVGGADAYGYVTQSDHWLDGSLRDPQPWARDLPWPASAFTFTPLGYSLSDDESSIVSQYPPGLPLIMAGAHLLAGRCAVFWVAPLCAGLLVVATYGLGRELGSRGAAIAAMWLVATSPAVLFMTPAPMSDVPAAAMWTTALWLAVSSTNLGRNRRSLWAGLVSGVAILIRPNLIPAAAPIVIWYAWEAWRNASDRRAGIARGVLFCAGSGAGVVTAVVLNHAITHWWLHTGYGSIEEAFGWGNVRANAANYFEWLISTQTPLAVAGLVALALPLPWLWPDAKTRSVVVLLAAFCLVIWIRYLLLSSVRPLVVLQISAAVLAGDHDRPRASGVAHHSRQAARPGVGWRRDRGGARRIRHLDRARSRGVRWRPARTALRVSRRDGAEMTDPTSVIFSMQHSGSIRYYGGRLTLNFVNLDRRYLDHTVHWLADHGAHPYAALEDWEVPEFKRRFADANTAGRLEMTPLFEYDGTAHVLLYDLLQDNGPRATGVIRETGLRPRCQPPARDMVVGFRR